MIHLPRRTLNTLAIVPAGKPFSLASAIGQRDGDPDLALGLPQQVRVFENLLGESSATFVESHALDIEEQDIGHNSTTLLVEDLNGDGRSDVVYTKTSFDSFDEFFGSFGRNFLSGFGGGSALFGKLEPRMAAAADIDLDGDLDLVTTSEGADDFLPIPAGVSSALNLGGQWGFTGIINPQVNERFATEGDLKSLLRFSVGLRAAVGDPSARVESFAVRFGDAANVALNSAQVNALIERLHVYRSASFAGLPAFSAANDILLTTVEELDLDPNGILGIAIPSGDPSLLVAAGAHFFLVAELADDAGSQPIRQFRTSYISRTFVLRSVLGGSPLLQEGRIAPAATAQPIFVSARVGTFPDSADLVPGDLSCDAGGGDCTLRAAIQEANARAGQDEIRLGPGVYTLGVPGMGEDTALTGDLDITAGNLTIIGAGAGQTIIDGGGVDRVFDIHAETVELRDLTIRNGRVTTADVLEGSGGGIRNRGGTLTIRNCVIEANEAHVGGGVGNVGPGFVIIGSQVNDNVAAARGGGIHNQGGGFPEIANSTIARNLAADGGGVANESGSFLTIRETTMSGNQAVPSTEGTGDGGGVWDLGSLSVIGSTIAFNSAARGGELRSTRHSSPRSPGTSWPTTRLRFPARTASTPTAICSGTSSRTPPAAPYSRSAKRTRWGWTRCSGRSRTTAA